MQTHSQIRIVIDLDNTLLHYDEVFHSVACREGWIDSAVPASKAAVKAFVYGDGTDPESKRRWLYLQSECYGNQIASARLEDAAVETLRGLRTRGWQVFIVSHKTRLSFDGRSLLQETARRSLANRGVLDLIAAENLIFCETLDEKIERIRSLRPDLIIDDLAHVLSDVRLAEFNRLHFSGAISREFPSRGTWPEIEALLNAIHRLTRGAFRLQKLETQGTNQVLTLTAREGSFVLKLFTEDERGRTCARNEARAARVIAEAPEHFGSFGAISAMTCVPSPRSVDPTEAYERLLALLVRTRDQKGLWRVNDDCATKREWLNNLDRRARRLGLEQDPQVRSRRAALAVTPEWSPLPSRFVLADFNPDAIVQSGGRSFFLDLEDAGMGDPARFLCNLLLHPKSAMSPAMSDRFCAELGVDRAHLARIREFSSLEWVLILMGSEKGRPLAAARLNQMDHGGAA